MSVLILSTATNEHANSIQENLERVRTACFRFNFGPAVDTRVNFEFDVETTAEFNGWRVCRDEVSGVFLHHPLPPSIKFAGADAIDAGLVKSGWLNTVDWFEHQFPDALWINKPSKSRSSAPILLQLRKAAALGMRVPKTVFTNDFRALRKLANRAGKTVIKSGPLLGVDLEGNRLLTHVVDANAIDESQLQASPCLFQEYIEKDVELRIHVIGDDIYACRIESQKSIYTKTDWRNYRLSETPHSIFTLDEGLANQCRALTRELGLGLGILDVIITPGGEAVFLECNAQGHWLWIEELTGMPITSSIANALKMGR